MKWIMEIINSLHPYTFNKFKIFNSGKQNRKYMAGGLEVW